MFRHLACATVLLIAGGLALTAQSTPRPNTLTATEQSAGWRLLFDGTSTKGWRGFKKPEGSINGWLAEGGFLRHPASGGKDSLGSGDIITTDTFNDFDLRFEWKVAPGGNSGVKYLVTEARSGPIAHEYQVIDDVKHPDALIGAHRSTGALYDVIPAPANKPLKPAGEINQGRILLDGNHVEHWLNGTKILEYELGSAALKAGKAKSKFKDEAGWEDKLKGHILLQDHGDAIWYQNVKIRVLPAKTTSR